MHGRVVLAAAVCCLACHCGMRMLQLLVMVLVAAVVVIIIIIPHQTQGFQGPARVCNTCYACSSSIKELNTRSWSVGERQLSTLWRVERPPQHCWLVAWERHQACCQSNGNTQQYIFTACAYLTTSSCHHWLMLSSRAAASATSEDTSPSSASWRTGGRLRGICWSYWSTWALAAGVCAVLRRLMLRCWWLLLAAYNVSSKVRNSCKQ